MPRLVPQRDIPAEWWAVFGAPELDALVRRALQRSPTLDQARARLAQAQELRAARAGATAYPQVDAAFGAVRQRIDPATFGFPQAPNPGPFNVFSLGADVSYNFDLFGGTRRELEALAAEVDYQGYELEAARADARDERRDDRDPARVARRADRRDVRHPRRAEAAARDRRGALPGRAACRGSTCRTSGHWSRRRKARSPPLRAQWAQAGHLLAVLMGESPADAELPEIRLAALALPAELPLRVPSELVRQRPDIRASEALLHKASANVGVATADLYPKLVISGSFSSSQLNLSDVLGNGINVWNIGANLLQPLFRGGELQARKRAAEAAYDQAAAGVSPVGAARPAERRRRAAGARGGRRRACGAGGAGRARRRRLPDHARPLRRGRREPARGARRRPEPAAGRDRPHPGRRRAGTPTRWRCSRRSAAAGRRGNEGQTRISPPSPMDSGGEIRV